MPAKRKKPAPRKSSAKKSPRPKPAEHDFEKGVDNFAEEMGKLGEKLGKRFEDKEKECDRWFRTTFGIVGPFLSSIIGIIILSLFIWVLGLVNVPIGSGLLQNIQYFLLAHVGWFFLIFFFFSYTSYISKGFPGAYRPISPIVSAAGIVVAIWIFLNVVKIANLSFNISDVSGIVLLGESMLVSLFYIFVIIGYLVLIAGISKDKCCGSHASSKREKKTISKDSIRTGRLYRSGNDRILGGVCGGISEYLGIDPVIIRLIWVICSLAWGSGILLYIIMWIIMPRNPRHKWED